MLKADLDILSVCRVNLPELAAGKIENPRDDNIRKLLQPGVVDGHRGIVEFSAVGDLILNLGNPVAELAESSIGFQLSLTLNHHEK